MIQSISNAYRIAAAESAINDHRLSIEGCDQEIRHCTAEHAADLLISLSHWAEVNGLCLRIKPVQVFSTEETDGDA